MNQSVQSIYHNQILCSSTEPSSIAGTPKNTKIPDNLLGMKTMSAIDSVVSSPRKQCSICLEYFKYSQSIALSCSSCEGSCHEKCYSNMGKWYTVNKNFKSFQCDRCINSVDTSNRIKCYLCNSPEGIMLRYADDLYMHVYCVRYIKEINDNINNGDVADIRKWRFKHACKLCRKVEEGVPVIKCSNSKCKNYYHLQCAKDQKLILSLEFQKDFYGLNENENINFYCKYHNKQLIHEYHSFTAQMDEIIWDEIKDEDCMNNDKDTQKQTEVAGDVEKKEEKNIFKNNENRENFLIDEIKQINEHCENAENIKDANKKEILKESPQKDNITNIIIISNTVENTGKWMENTRNKNSEFESNSANEDDIQWQRHETEPNQHRKIILKPQTSTWVNPIQRPQLSVNVYIKNECLNEAWGCHGTDHDFFQNYEK